MVGNAVGRGRTHFWASCVAVLAAALLLASGADAAQLRLVGGPGAADGDDCLAAPCATIAHAIAEADPGDSVQIAAGSYDEQLTIDKPLTLQGDPSGGTRLGPAAVEGVVAGSTVKLAAGASGTVLRDLEIDSHAQYEAAIATSGGPLDGVALEGVTVRGLGPSASPPSVAPGLEISVMARGWKILGSSFEANYQGILVSGDASAMTIEGSRFDRNREGLDVLRSVPLGPDSSGTIDGLVLHDSRFAENEYRGLYFEGLSDARIESVAVTGTGRGKQPLPNGAVGLALNLKAGEYGDVSISDSSFADSVNEGVRVQVRGAASDSPAYQAAPATLESFALRGSTLSGNGGPGIAIENEANLEAATIGASRIVGNGSDAVDAVAPVSGVFAWNAGGTAIAASGNWFGCNAGPAAPQAGCDDVGAPVAAAPWLVLTAAASAPALAPGGSAAISAALATDSAGSPAPPAPDGTPVSFAAVGGTVAPAAATLVGGAAGASFTAGAPGEAGVWVTVDGQRIAVPLSVLVPPREEERVPPTEEKHSAPSPQPPPPPPAPPMPPASVAPSGDGGAVLVAPGSGPMTVATVTCAAGSCRVAARKPTLKVGGRTLPVRVRVARRVAGGDSVPVRVVLPRKARQALARSGKGRLRIRVAVTGSDGTVRTVTVRVVLRAKRGHRNDGHR